MARLASKLLALRIHRRGARSRLTSPKPIPALRWTQELPHAAARTEANRAIHRHWLANDPVAAQASAAATPDAPGNPRAPGP